MAPTTGRGPWVERHRPRHLGEVIGNTDAVRKLAEWLRDWDDVVLHGKEKEQKKPEAWQKFAPAPENLNARAALISGPPGIGKTTTCALLARCSPKYGLMEFNASDARTKVIVENMSKSLAGNHVLKFGNGKNSSGKGLERTIIIFDECDGMSGGDKGGMQALKKMIQTTKNPIICICNDRGDANVRDLASVCYDIKFKKPENSVMAKRIKHVLEREGKRVEVRAIEAVIENCGQDVRQILNQVQFFGRLATPGSGALKDVQGMMGPFDACEQLFKSRGAKVPPLQQRMDWYYLDTDMMPLMIQENYLRGFQRRSIRSPEQELQQACQAAELIALGDTMSSEWEVQASSGLLSTVYPAYLTGDEVIARPTFPVWLQRRSGAAKAQRSVEDLYNKAKNFTSCPKSEFVTSSYSDMLYRSLVRPLQQGNAKEAAAALFNMNLTRDFYTEQAPLFRTPLDLEDIYKRIDSKLKNQLREQLTVLVQEANTDPVKRKAEAAAGRAAKKPRFGAFGELLPDTDTQVDDEAAAADKKKAAAKKKPRRENERQAVSLMAWKQKKEGGESEWSQLGENGKKKPLLIMKYLDGHTNAVRRKVHLKDFMEPWRMF
nr:replication factor C subunit 1 [Crypthecodinium cohnii]